MARAERLPANLQFPPARRVKISPLAAPGRYSPAMLSPCARYLSITALVALPLLTALGSGPEASNAVAAYPAAPETLADLIAQGQGPEAASTCGNCHTEIYAEWKGHKHAGAWTDEIYQAAIAAKTRPEICHNCHIPNSVLDRLGSRPRVRDKHLDEGVTCVACHQQ